MRATERGISKNQLISELVRSPHEGKQGKKKLSDAEKLGKFLPLGREGVRQEPDFFSHLMAWNAVNGEVRDSKVAMPVIYLIEHEPGVPQEFTENALAHLAALDPRNLKRAVSWLFSLRGSSRGYVRAVKRVVRDYMHFRESEWGRWERMVMQHRSSVQWLYANAHVKPKRQIVGDILFMHKYPKGSVFEALANLRNMSVNEAAGTIMERKLSFLPSLAALKEKAADPTIVLALMGVMSPSELVTRAKWLEKVGVRTNPALRAAFEEATGKASKSSKNLLKTTKAADAVEDEGLRRKLHAVQEKQIASLKGIEGNWLVLGDRSPSMKPAIEGARHIAGTLAKMVKGNVMLVFFDESPFAVDVTGLSYDDIRKVTKTVTTGNGTSVGCGLQYVMDMNMEFDGIAIISDAEENRTPFFADVYRRYCDKVGKNVPVYLYRYPSKMEQGYDVALSMRNKGFDVQEFKMSTDGGDDYVALPNLIQTMRSNRYGLVQEIQETPLLTLAEVFA